MADDRAKDGDSLYAESDYARFAEILGISKLSRKDINHLEGTAATYWVISQLRGEVPPKSRHLPVLPSAKELRAALNKVRNSALKLAEALENPAFRIIPKEGKLADFDIRILRDLAEAADKVAKRKARAGRPQHEVREYFICELLSLYLKITESQPCDLDSTAHKHRFKELVRAAIEPLNSHALTGVDQATEKVISESATDS